MMPQLIFSKMRNENLEFIHSVNVCNAYFFPILVMLTEHTGSLTDQELGELLTGVLLNGLYLDPESRSLFLKIEKTCNKLCTINDIYFDLDKFEENYSELGAIVTSFLRNKPIDSKEIVVLANEISQTFVKCRRLNLI